MKLATDMVEAETSSILLYDIVKDELVFNIALTEKESSLKEVRLKMGEGIAGMVAKERRSRISNDIKTESGWTNRTDNKIDFKTRSILAVPLIYKDKLMGVVEAINKKNGQFTQEDAGVLEAFAAQAAVSIENAKLFGDLAEEKDKIESMFSQMSDGAVFFDTKGNKLFLNRRAENLIGEENTRRASVFDIFADFTVSPSIAEIIKEDMKTVNAEFCRSIGKPLYLFGTFNKIINAHNNVNGIMLVFNDVTVEKRESILKRNFLSLISHKLRTPLVSIIGYCPILLADKDLNDFNRKAVSSIQRQGSLLANLVDKLLNFTIVESDRLDIVKKPNSLVSVLESSLVNLKTYIEQEKADVRINDDVKHLPEIGFDKDKIEIVIRNLVENAVKFNKAAEKKVDIYAFKKNSSLGLAIKDNGPGIPPEEREKIFQKFYQIEESFTGQVEGAGLGLNFVKQVVEVHGGEVGVESQIGSGSSFYFVLPMK
jgi:signal transduction histidine kinase